MAITMGDEPGVSFEWPVRDLANKRLKFEVEEIGYELVLERNCDDNEDDRIVPQIREVLINGDWSVTTYIEGDINKTEIYGGYSIQLMEDHQISIKEGGEAFGEGLWRVLRNSEERLKVYLNFGANMPFDELTDDWLFVSMTSVSLELIRLNEDGTTDILIMER